MRIQILLISVVASVFFMLPAFAQEDDDGTAAKTAAASDESALWGHKDLVAAIEKLSSEVDTLSQAIGDLETISEGDLKKLYREQYVQIPYSKDDCIRHDEGKRVWTDEHRFPTGYSSPACWDVAVKEKCQALGFASVFRRDDDNWVPVIDGKVFCVARPAMYYTD